MPTSGILELALPRTLMGKLSELRVGKVSANE